MGQTLSHGVYLPNEGERNCYAGLASNWQILNTAVGAIAEKAPLVHTHTVSQITDFPTLATVATSGSYNDLNNIPASFTPSSHTHGNLTNDGKVGTAANKPLITGTGGAVQAGSFGNQANTFCEGNDSRLSDARTPVAHTHTKSDVTDLFNSANRWTGTQTYGACLKSFGEARADDWSSNSRTNMYLLSKRDTEDVSGFLINTFRSNVAQGTAMHICGWDILENSTRYSGLRFTIDWDSTLNSGNGAYRVTLGTNTQGTNPCNDLHITQLKTINGINPGALSLPNINYTEGNPDVYNVGTDINNLTKNTTDPLHFSWTSPFDGWLSIMWYLNGINPPYNVLVQSNSDARVSKFSQTWSASSSRGYLATTFPVVKNVTYYFNIDFQNTTIGVVHHAYLLPCLGNV